jgi:hypothetical protein
METKFTHTHTHSPNNYAAIILSRIVSSPTEGPLTTELSVGFELPLPYHTKDGSTTSLLVAAGLDVALNVVLGLPFIKAMGMIAGFVDNVCKAKHLCYLPFPIDFKCSTKLIPAFSDSGACTFASATGRRVIHILGMLNSFFSCKEEGHNVHIVKPSSTDIVPFQSKRPTNNSEDDNHTKIIWFGNQWTPPSTSASAIDDYNRRVLGDLGYL